MINSRDIKDLTPEAQAAFWRFAQRCLLAGYAQATDWTVISTRRDQEYQDWLFEQGRTRFPGPIVTWTHDSKHIKGTAWDIAILNGKDIFWESPLYGNLAEIGREAGLDCGFFWKKRDPGHFQLPEVVK
jgi:hypothetical protein